jgi:hypothetical protein
MDKDQIREFVARFDTADTLEHEKIWEQLRPVGEAVVPIFLEAYPQMKKWQGRASLLYHATKFARKSDDAFKLGLLAINDRSRAVRYRGLGLLAYSLNPEALPYLEAVLRRQDQNIEEDVRAAIDAIEHLNHHYFIDRDHTGQIFWEVG